MGEDMKQVNASDVTGNGWIDVDFDVFSDTPAGKDPDSHSPTLRRYHSALWGKPLPDGRSFQLSTDTRGVYLHHKSAAVGEFFLGSDTVATEHSRKLHHLYEQCSSDENTEFTRRSYTIGGTLIFPNNQVSGKQTINQQRGMHPQILDRVDLTLECIYRHYAGTTSPLTDTIERHANFFALFGSFFGYTSFFYLQDMLEADGRVKFLIPFDKFGASPLPHDLESYRAYRRRTLEFVAARNQRIRASLATSQSDRL
jgi:hypothetical protein